MTSPRKSPGADRSAQPAYEGVRVLVLGATGFIGRRVVRALLARGAVVTAAGRDPAALNALNAQIEQNEQNARNARSGVTAIVWDATRTDDAAALIRSVEPVVTFNLAGYGVDRSERDEGMAQRINAELPAVLARSILLADSWPGQALVHAGSALEYGEAEGDLNEDTRPLPTTLYGRTKLAGTRALAEHSMRRRLRAVTARLFTVYGPGEHPGRLLPALLECARTSAPIPLSSGEQRRDFTFVDDVAEGMLRLGACSTAPGDVVNLATGRLESVRTFVERSARVLGIEPDLLQFGAIAVRSEEMAHEPVAVQRLRALTGWIPATPIEEGVRLTLREMKSTNAKV